MAITMLFKFQQFMQGRYGMDKLNIAIGVLGCVATFVTSFFHIGWFRLLVYIPFVVVILRALSKNIYKRQHENEVFMSAWAPWSAYFTKKFNRMKDTEHKYFDCPQCKRTLRVPVGRGKIEISCPHCGKKFKKRT